MRKLHYILAGLVLVFALGSCEKNDKHDLDVDAMKAAKADKVIVDLGPNEPVSNAGVTPEVIPGENNGGNRTCEEVWEWFVEDQIDWELGVDFLCGDKVDWDDDAEGFAESFPDGLNVTVTGIHVGFTIDGCLEINGGFYKVGAVIVKGSNAANVYFYEGGTTADFGLAAPGNKHMVSNLTFCFVPCEPEEVNLVVAMKAFVYDPNDRQDVIHTVGTALPNIDFVGYEPYVLGSGPVSYDLQSELSGTVVGTMIVDDGMDGDEHYFFVEIDTYTTTPEWDFDENGCYLYIGSEAGLLPLVSAGQFPFRNDAPPESRSFKILVSDVISMP